MTSPLPKVSEPALRKKVSSSPRSVPMLLGAALATASGTPKARNLVVAADGRARSSEP